MPDVLTLTIDGKPYDVDWSSPNAPTQRDVDEIERQLRVQLKLGPPKALVNAASSVPDSLGKMFGTGGKVAPNPSPTMPLVNRAAIRNQILTSPQTGNAVTVPPARQAQIFARDEAPTQKPEAYRQIVGQGTVPYDQLDQSARKWVSDYLGLAPNEYESIRKSGDKKQIGQLRWGKGNFTERDRRMKESSAMAAGFTDAVRPVTGAIDAVVKGTVGTYTEPFGVKPESIVGQEPATSIVGGTLALPFDVMADVQILNSSDPNVTSGQKFGAAFNILAKTVGPKVAHGAVNALGKGVLKLTGRELDYALKGAIQKAWQDAKFEPPTGLASGKEPVVAGGAHQPTPNFEFRPRGEGATGTPKPGENPGSGNVGSTPTASTTKEPWQMTSAQFAGSKEVNNFWGHGANSGGVLIDGTYARKAYFEEALRKYGDNGYGYPKKWEGPRFATPEAALKWAENYHLKSVKQALKDGKPVPPEVLADYPDLAATYGKVPISEPAPVSQPGNLPETGKVAPEASPNTPKAPTTPETGLQGPESPVTTGPKVSAQNASMAEQLTARGMNHPTAPDKQTVQSWVDKAHAKGIPDQAVAIAKDVVDHPRQLDNVETTGIAIAAQRNTNKVAQLMEQLDHATLPEDIARISKAIDAKNEEFGIMAEAVRNSGTEWGRSGVARQAELRNDTSFDGLRRNATKTWERPPTTEELVRIKADADEIARLRSELEKFRAAKVAEDLGTEIKSGRSGGSRSTQARAMKEQAAEELRDAIKRAMSSAHSNPLPEISEVAYAAGKWLYHAIREKAWSSLEQFMAHARGELKGMGVEISDDDLLRGYDAYRRSIPTKNALQSEEAKIRAQLAQEGKKAAERAGDEGAVEGKIAANEKRQLTIMDARASKLREFIKTGENDPKRAASPELTAARKALAQLESQANAIRENASRPTKQAKYTVDLTKRLKDIEQAIKEGRYEDAIPQSKPRRALTEAEIRLQRKVREAQKIAQANIAMKTPMSWQQRINSWLSSAALVNVAPRVLDLAANTIKLGSEILSAPLDWAISRVVSPALKGSGKGLTEIGFDKVRRMMIGYGDAVKNDFKITWKGGDLDAISKYGPPGLGGKVAGMTDVPFKELYARGMVDDMAVQQARLELGKGASKEAVQELAAKYAADPTDEMVAAAHEYALRQTFNKQNALSNTIEGFASSVEKKGGPINQGGAILIRTIFRFNKVIGNVAAERLAYTPAGVGAGLIKAINVALRQTAATAAEIREITQLIRKGMVGTGLYYAGKSLYDSGLLQPKVMKTESGSVYVDYGVMDQFGGLFSPLLIGAGVRAIENSSLTDNQKSSAIWNATVDYVTSTPIASDLKDTVRSLGSAESAAKQAGKVVSRILIPSLVRDAAKAGDMKEGSGLGYLLGRTGKPRDVKTKGFFDELARNLPGARNSLPESPRKTVN